MNVVTKTLACAGLAAVAVAGVSLPAQATASPVSAAAFASQAPAPAAVQSITQFKWPTLKAGEAGEMKLRIKPARGVALPTAAGVDLQIEAPNGAIFNNAKVVLEDPTSLKKETLTGTLSADHTKLTVTSKSAQASSAYGIRAIFNLYAVNPTDGDQWGTFRITGGGAFAPTTASYSYKGIASEVPAPIEQPLTVTAEGGGVAGGAPAPADDWFDRPILQFNKVGFKGYGTPGASVVLTDPSGHVYGITTVGEDGIWTSYDRDYTFSDGTYEITATQTHGEDKTTAITRFSVNLVALDINWGTLKLPYTITGTGYPGQQFVLSFADRKYPYTYTSVVGPDGTWSITPEESLKPDTYEMGVRRIQNGIVDTNFFRTGYVTIKDR